MRSILQALVIVGAIYAAVVLTVYLQQRSLMFAPEDVRFAPAAAGMSDMAEVTLVTKSGLQLFSWYAAAQPRQPTLLYLHGNGGSVRHRVHKYQQFLSQGYGVFALGYPGYGGSEGVPSEAALVDVANLAYDHLRQLAVPQQQLVLYGESLGTAVAVQLAAAKPVAALILEAPMNSVLEIARAQYPFLPVAALLRDRFLSHDYVPQIVAPLLVIHGTADGLIPFASGRRLFEQANEPKVLHAVPGGGHNNLYDFPVTEVVTSFLATQLPATQTEGRADPADR